MRHDNRVLFWGAWLGFVAAACESDPPTMSSGTSRPALVGPQADVAQLCGFACPERGLEDGNAVISGVGPADALFATVLGFANEADAIAVAIENQLDAIDAAFGGDPTALAAMHVQGPLRVRVGQPSCSVDSDLLLGAQARCDRKLKRDSARMSCFGRCELRSSDAECADGELSCTRPSAGACAGACRGACVRPSSAQACDGVCRGSCSEGCSVFDASGACRGRCTGKCDGTCEQTLFDAADCDGDCLGECVDDAASSCGDGMLAECVTPSGGESVVCDGRCNGAVQAADGVFECMAVAAFEAVANAVCRPSGARIDAVPLPAADADEAAARAQFFTALSGLERRLPGLLALAARGERLLDASVGLSDASVDDKLLDSLKAQNAGSIHTRSAVGLECAQAELGNVPTVIAAHVERLDAALAAVAVLRDSLESGP